MKILDFGIAKLTHEASTKAGKNTSAIGSRPWMAPEQAKVGSDIGPPVDVWAIGLIAFYLITGKHYWRAMSDPNANDMMLVMEVCMTGDLDPASLRAAHLGVAALPPMFDAWFARCVVRDARARFEDAAVAFLALGRPIEAAVPPSEERLSPTQAMPSPALGRTAYAEPLTGGFDRRQQDDEEPAARLRQDSSNGPVEPLNHPLLVVGVVVYLVAWSKIWGWW